MTQTAVDVLRVRWQPGRGATVASLVGAIDADAEPVVLGLGRVAQVARRVVIDLSRATRIDPYGLELMRSLCSLPNVSVQWPGALSGLHA